MLPWANTEVPKLKHVSIEGYFKNIWKVYFWAVGSIVSEQLSSFLLLNLGMKVKQSRSCSLFCSRSVWIQLDQLLVSSSDCYLDLVLIQYLSS